MPVELIGAIIYGVKKETLRLLKLMSKKQLEALVKEPVDEKGYHLFHYLARYNDLEAIRFLREQLPAELFEQMAIEVVGGHSPLLLAAFVGAHEVVDYFVAGEKPVDFFTEHQDDAFYGEPFSATEKFGREELLLPSSPLYCAIGGNNLDGLKTLMSSLLNDAKFQEQQPEKLLNFLISLINLAIETQRLDLLPDLVESTYKFSIKERLSWLTKEFESLLPINHKDCQIEYIEKNSSDPVAVINLLYSEENSEVPSLEVTKELIYNAVANSCLSLSRGLLAQVVDETTRKEVVQNIVTTGLKFYNEVKKNGGFYYFNGMDSLDVAAIVCADYFNRHPTILAELLEIAVASSDAYVVTAFLRYLSPAAIKQFLSHTITAEEPKINGMTLLQLAKHFQAYHIVDLLNLCTADNTAKLNVMVFLQEKYNRMVGKIIADEATEETINELVRAVEAIRTMGDKDRPVTCIRGLFKALICLTNQNNDKSALRIYQLLKNELSVTKEGNTLHDFNMYMTLLEYGIILQDKSVFTYLDHLSSIAKVLANTERQLSVMPLAKLMLTRLTLMLCLSTDAQPSLEMNRLQKRISTNKGMLRFISNRFSDSDEKINLDIEGFSLPSPIPLLSLANPKALSIAELEELYVRSKQFKHDRKNYNGIDLSEEIGQSPVLTQITKRTLDEHLYVYQRWRSVEKTLCPEAFMSLPGKEEELQKIRFFLKIKTKTIDMLIANISSLATALKSDMSSILTKMQEEFDKTVSEKKTIKDLFSARQNQSDEYTPAPPINPLILWAIERKDSEIFSVLLKKMPSKLFVLPYQSNTTIASYLAEQLVRAGCLKELKELEAKCTTENITLNKEYLISIAVTENHTDIVKHFGLELLPPLHVDAYNDKVPEKVNAGANKSDVRGRLPLNTAISSGKKQAVKRLKPPFTPGYLVLPQALVLECLRPKSLHILPEFLSEMTETDLETLLPDIFKVVQKKFKKNPMPALQEFVAKVGKEKIAKIAMREGYLDIMLAVLGSYELKSERLEVACNLLKNAAAEYGEYKSSEVVAAINEKNRNGNPLTERIYAASIADKEKSLRINLNIRNSKAVGQLAYLMMDEFKAFPEQLNIVLSDFISHNHHDGMRELLASLPPDVAKTAIDYLPTQQSRTISLIDSTIINKQDDFWYLLEVYDADLRRKNQANAKMTLKELIDHQHKMGSKTVYLVDSFNQEKCLQEFMKLLNKLMRGEMLPQKDIERVIKNIQTSKGKLIKLNKCLENVWQTVNWCTEHAVKQTHFDSAVRLVRAIMPTVPGVTANDYRLCASLELATGNIGHALSNVHELERAICKTSVLGPLEIAQLTTIKLTLLTMTAFKCTIPPKLMWFYKENWHLLSEKQNIGEGFLPFITASSIKLDKKSLKKFRDDLELYKISNKQQRGVINETPYLDKDATPLEIEATNIAIFSLLVEVEKTLNDCKDNELLQLFYLTAKELMAFVKISIDTLKLDFPKEMKDFAERLSKLERLYSHQLKASEKNNVPKQQNNDKKNDDKKEHKSAPQKDVSSKDKSKKTGHPGFGGSLAPEEQQAPWAVHIEVEIPKKETPEKETPKKETPKKVTPKKEAPKKEAQQNSQQKKKNTAFINKSISDAPAGETNTKQDKVNAPLNVNDNRHFPGLPSVPRKIDLSKLILFKPVIKVALSETVLSAPEELLKDPLRDPLYKPKTLLPEPILPKPFLPEIVLANSTLPKIEPPFDVYPEDIIKILLSFDKDGKPRAKVFGGAVRDALLGRQIRDFDVKVDLSPDELKKALEEKFGVENVKEQGNKIRSWSVFYKGLNIDFVSSQDAKSDFTINEFEWHLTTGLIDPALKGMSDMNEGYLSFSDPVNESFYRNSKLIYRLIRFEKMLDFKLGYSVLIALERDKEDIINNLEYVDIAILEMEYQKLFYVFKNNVIEFHAKLKQYGIFEVIQSRLPECAKNEKEVNAKSAEKQETQTNSARI